LLKLGGRETDEQERTNSGRRHPRLLLLLPALADLLRLAARRRELAAGGPFPLADFFARALRAATGASAAAVDMLAAQAPMDGVLSYLPAGPVSKADVLRLYPWPDATVVGEVGEEEVRKVANSAWPKSWTAWGFDRADEGAVSLAVVEGDAAEHVERTLGRRVSWRRTGVGLREAVGGALG
jgi:hypothetical protein